MEGGLASSSASSLSTLGWILSGSMDLCPGGTAGRELLPHGLWEVCSALVPYLPAVGADHPGNNWSGCYGVKRRRHEAPQPFGKTARHFPPLLKPSHVFVRLRLRSGTSTARMLNFTE